MSADYRTLWAIVKDLADADVANATLVDLQKRAKAAVAPSPPKNDPMQLHRIPDDAGCCTKELNRLAKQGNLDNSTRMTCVHCGTIWRPQEADGVKNWQAESDVQVFKVRG